jgi:hypothetical protein
MNEYFRFYNLFNDVVTENDVFVLINREYLSLPGRINYLDWPKFQIPFQNFKFLVDYTFAKFYKNNVIDLLVWLDGQGPCFSRLYVFFLLFDKSWEMGCLNDIPWCPQYMFYPFEKFDMSFWGRNLKFDRY